jgi:hypothetical protein
MNLQNQREKGYKENPYIASVTDFLMEHKAELKKLHIKYMKDTKKNIEFPEFVFFIYENAQDLVINPEMN